MGNLVMGVSGCAVAVGGMLSLRVAITAYTVAAVAYAVTTAKDQPLYLPLTFL